MVRQVNLEFVFQHLNLENDESEENIFKTINGLYFKRRPEADKAKQEYLATRLARLMLPQNFCLPQTWGVIDGRFITEVIETNDFDVESREHIILGATCLSELHSISLSGTMIAEMRRCGYCHYEGEALRNRLSEEFQKAETAFSEFNFMEATLADFRQIVLVVTREWNFVEDIVLGHGDYQAQNLKVDDDRIIPIDWTDFGLCDRSYEVAHYLNSLNEEFRQLGIETYERNANIALANVLDRGGTIDGIIRAGSAARQVCDLGESGLNEQIQHRFQCSVETARCALDRYAS